MQKVNFQNLYRNTTRCFSSKTTKRILTALAIVSIAGITTQIFAAGGGTEDLLAGTETAVMGTLQGTGKKYLYIAEGVASLLAYIQTKNVAVLVGIIIVAVFFNIILALVAKV